MIKPNAILVKFIKETRKRGISDLESKDLMLAKNWPSQEIERAFLSLQPKYKFKNQVCIFLNNEVSQAIEKRAKKNMFTVSEQIEDILRRSCVTKKKTLIDNIDDKFLSFFSRKKR